MGVRGRGPGGAGGRRARGLGAGGPRGRAAPRSSRPREPLRCRFVAAAPTRQVEFPARRAPGRTFGSSLAAPTPVPAVPRSPVPALLPLGPFPGLEAGSSRSLKSSALSVHIGKGSSGAGSEWVIRAGEGMFPGGFGVLASSASAGICFCLAGQKAVEDLCRGQLGDQSFGCHGAWSLGLQGGACLGFSEGGMEPFGKVTLWD